jgi:hypothetical protein
MGTNLSRTIALALAGLLAGTVPCAATPQFARAYRVDCTHCHASPPRLNARGLAFQAAGYRLDGLTPSTTLPLAVWNTVDLERRYSTDLTKAYPSRVELISAGRLGRSRAVYFAEWRALSQSVGSGGRLLNRSGRFEDLFVRAPVTPTGTWWVSVGQFRALTQVDVSLRLSLSEPLAFSSSVAGPRASTSRLTSLRGFSASGRQPALRAEYQSTSSTSTADGWYVAATLPLVGEVTLPFSDAASFELEARPKGLFVETYRRAGLGSVGGHTFIGRDGQRLATVVVTHDVRDRVVLMASLGAFHASGVTDTRFSVGGELNATQALVGGVRVDHRTGQGREPAVVLYANVHLPFGPDRFRQAFRLQVEHRVQPANHATALGVSHVF